MDQARTNSVQRGVRATGEVSLHTETSDITTSAIVVNSAVIVVRGNPASRAGPAFPRVSIPPSSIRR